ncbi:High mobility group B protein 6 [Orobanche gracilis]
MSAYFIFSNERRSALLVEKKNVLEVKSGKGGAVLLSCARWCASRCDCDTSSSDNYFILKCDDVSQSQRLAHHLAQIIAQPLPSRKKAAKITGEEWKNMTEKQREPYDKMASKNKEEYTKEMEVYRQKKEEENAIHKKEEEELMKLQKQEAMQLLKKKEKNETLIKKTKENHQKRKEKNVDPNKPKKPASSFFIFSKEARKALAEERPGITNSTLTALISVKWKELGNEDKQIWNGKVAERMEAYKKEMEAYNKKLAAPAATTQNKDTWLDEYLLLYGSIGLN